MLSCRVTSDSRLRVITGDVLFKSIGNSWLIGAAF